ncbi:MAG TPA: hypothetical protein VM165_23655, partial [Planctomycetaceae bacterium]|nr:hypothetical protein [Planctomycetaceae bacterium]
VRMFDQDFFVMRHRDYGMCLWGPNPPADVAGFLRVAEHFGAKEQTTAAGRITRWFSMPVR